MSISWIIIVFTSYSRDNLPIGLQYITIQLVCNKREYKYYIICVYPILIWPQMIQGQMSRPVNNKILWKIWVIEKNRMSGKMSFVGRDCLQSSNLVQIEGCSDAILTTRVKTGRYSVSKWVRLHSGFGRVIVFGVWIYCVWMDERTRILVTFWLKPISH